MSDQAKPSVIAELKPYNGVPTIFVNGMPKSGLVYMTYWPKSQPIAEFGRAGVHMHSFPSTCCHHIWENMVPACWSGPDHYEYSHLDRQIEQILAADPEALVFPRVYLMSPRWWDELHPDQLVTVDDGGGNYVHFYETNKKRCPSWASSVWRQDTAESFRRYIEHIQAAPYAEHVIGYHIASGTTEEWMYWGGNVQQYGDFSPANLQGFKSWLRKEYHDDLAGLRSAWTDLTVDFKSVTIPNKAERLHTGKLYFRDPAAEMRTVDYLRYMSDMTAETICYFASVMKEATQRQALCGVFYGYINQLANARDHRWQNAGHLALRQVLDSPDIDFLCSPSHYSARHLGPGGYSMFMSLTDSVKLHGKTWFDENDYPTCLGQFDNNNWGWTKTIEDTIAVERRELANVLGNAVCMWWFDLTYQQWFSDPQLLAEIGHHERIAARATGWPRSSVSEIGVLVDEKSVCYLQMESAYPQQLIVRQLPELGRLGAPFSLYLLDDLDRLSGDEHKLWILLNAFAPTEAQRRLIHARLQRDGRSLLWYYAPGLVRGHSLSAEAMSELTGITLRYELGEAPMLVVADGQRYGYETAHGPLCWADDPAAEVWGLLEGSGYAGLVTKAVAGGRAYYSAAPCMPAPLLRKIARQAGVHIYSDRNDIIYVNRSIIGVCVDEGGPRTIQLAAPADVYDLFNDTWLAHNTASFEVDLPSTRTGLYYIGKETEM